MTARILIRPKAQADMDETAEYLGQGNPTPHCASLPTPRKHSSNSLPHRGLAGFESISTPSSKTCVPGASGVSRNSWSSTAPLATGSKSSAFSTEPATSRPCCLRKKNDSRNRQSHTRKGLRAAEHAWIIGPIQPAAGTLIPPGSGLGEQATADRQIPLTHLSFPDRERHRYQAIDAEDQGVATIRSHSARLRAR